MIKRAFLPMLIFFAGSVLVFNFFWEEGKEGPLVSSDGQGQYRINRPAAYEQTQYVHVDFAGLKDGMPVPYLPSTMYYRQYLLGQEKMEIGSWVAAEPQPMNANQS